MNKIITFLDILGFSNYIKNNIAGAVNLISDYSTIIKIKIADNRNHPSSSYNDKDLSLSAENHLVDSFEYFLPCSDSIFIISNSPDKFLKQLSLFLIDSFLIDGYYFKNSENPNDPTDITIKSIGITKNKTIVVDDIKSKRYPLFFRGGISYGEVIEFPTNAIVNSNLVQTAIPAGSAVVNAVNLEKSGKGPRLFCDKEFYTQLNEESKLFVKEIDEKKFEILWPAFYFDEHKKNSLEIEKTKINELFTIAINLWRAFKTNPEIASHYFEFLKLLVNSTSEYYKYKNGASGDDEFISSILQNNGVELLHAFLW
ncbi:MAG: hypothetical protein ACYCT7_03135 [bacterium]